MIITIAIHTFQESVRRKIPHVLIGLGILIIVFSPFIPTTEEPDALPKIMMVVFFQVVVLVCNIGILLLAATSIPREIESKTLYGILSKPISKLKFVLGRITGFSIVSALILAVLALFHLAAIEWSASGLPEEYKGIVKAREMFHASQFSIQGKPHHVHGETIWIEGGKKGFASWNFSELYAHDENKNSFEIECNIKIESDREHFDDIPLIAKTENTLSGEFVTEVLSAKIDTPLTFKLNPAIIQKAGVVHIALSPESNSDFIGVTRENVKVFSVQQGFLLNYAKAIFITFLKFLLIVVVAVLGSSYLSTSVSVLYALVIFLCGHMVDFLRDFTLLIHGHDIHAHGLETAMKKPNTFLLFLDSILKKPLEWVSFLLPDFKKFDSLKFLLKGVSIPDDSIGASVGYTALYACVCIVIATIILKNREFS
ncbi:MAG: ABC transporter permease [Candidatus Brocadiaceae bacterium]|nr:ABC transporter permease [Candidatus Brocadiaceae bacterium]